MFESNSVRLEPTRTMFESPRTISNTLEPCSDMFEQCSDPLDPSRIHSTHLGSTRPISDPLDPCPDPLEPCPDPLDPSRIHSTRVRIMSVGLESDSKNLEKIRDIAKHLEHRSEGHRRVRKAKYYSRIHPRTYRNMCYFIDQTSYHRCVPLNKQVLMIFHKVSFEF